MQHFTPPAPVIAYRDTPEGQREQSAEILRRLGSDKRLPPFLLTNEQRAEIDMLATNDARTWKLQVLHQAHCFKHRDLSIRGMAASGQAFTRWWSANEARFISEAWAAYLGAELAA